MKSPELSPNADNKSAAEAARDIAETLHIKLSFLLAHKEGGPESPEEVRAKQEMEEILGVIDEPMPQDQKQMQALLDRLTGAENIEKFEDEVTKLGISPSLIDSILDRPAH